MHPIADGELRDLLLPVLACLPTAFLSPRPPPALLPSLSPILRQRVHLLASSSSTQQQRQPGNDGWLHLLTWSKERQDRLAEVVSGLQLEPHPVSGELELFGDGTDPDAGKVWYRRLDEETVQARCDLGEYGLGFVWAWCADDSGGIGLEALEGQTVGEPSSGWRVAEVIPLEGSENLELEGWSEELDRIEQGTTRAVQDQDRAGVQVENNQTRASNEDDDYWAAYDQTPGETPARKESAAPGSSAINRTLGVGSGRGNTEQDYFARYGEVQPAMDAHDPDEEQETGPVESTLDGNGRNHHGGLHEAGVAASEQAGIAATARPQQPDAIRTVAGNNIDAQDPVSASVASLEASAAGSEAVEASVKHHISGEIKSLFRLAQSVGIERGEFERVVQRELEVLGLIEL